MRVMRALFAKVYEVEGNNVYDIPSGGIGFAWSTCSFCSNKCLCLVHDNSYGEYKPASICEGCIDLIREDVPKAQEEKE